MRTLLLGEALVDLVGGPEGGYVAFPGGAVANVAVAASRLGAQVALAGGAGADRFGRWLREHLENEGVGLEWFALLEGVRTPVAFVAIDDHAEPSFQIYGEGIASTVVALADRVDEAVEACDALFVSSNTLVADDEREVTLRARERALELERPVVVDPNLRLHRWPSATRAAGAARELLPGAFLVRCNREEAELLTGEPQPEAAALSLVAAGARHAVVTRGPDGALLRGGGLHADVPGEPADAKDTTGAGDVLTGTLLARLAASDFYPPTLAAALPEAVGRAARATEDLGANPPGAFV